MVEVSPSTVTRLKVIRASSSNAFCICSAVIAQSVVIKASMVPILGWIMPEPLQMPPIWQTVPPASNSTAMVLTFVSVVMIASAAVMELSYFISILPACSSIASTFKVWPITPVEATITSSASTPSARAAAAASLLAFSMPNGAQALALPEFTITALAFPLARCSFVRRMGAALTRFVVYTAAALHSQSERIIARSFLVWDLRIPQRIAPALKPFAAHTPPSMIFMPFPLFHN